MKSTVKLTALVVLITLFLLPVYSDALSIQASMPSGEIDYERVISSINVENVKRHILYFSRLGSRFPGYPGYYQAAEYIHHIFKGLSVSEQSFDIVLPVDYGANITILPNGPTFKAYPLWPNMVSPPTINGSITGHLI